MSEISYSMLKLKDLGGRDFIREKVRERDKHTCQICFKKWKEGQRRFDVHHLDENESKNGRKYQNNSLESLVTLCHRCHLNLPHVRKRMSEGHNKGRKKNKPT